jgi:hypothetical protein
MAFRPTGCCGKSRPVVSSGGSRRTNHGRFALTKQYGSGMSATAAENSLNGDGNGIGAHPSCLVGLRTASLLQKNRAAPEAATLISAQLSSARIGDYYNFFYLSPNERPLSSARPLGPPGSKPLSASHTTKLRQ